MESLIRKHKCNIKAQTQNGYTALHVACFYKNKQVIERLLLSGTDANLQSARSQETPLHCLLNNFDSRHLAKVREIVQLLLPFCEDSLEARDSRGLMPFEMLSTSQKELRKML